MEDMARYSNPAEMEHDLVDAKHEISPEALGFQCVWVKSEEITQTIKKEAEELDVKQTTCVLKQEKNEVKEEILPLSREFSYTDCKSEEASKLISIANVIDKTKQHSAPPGPNEIKRMYLEEHGQRTSTFESFACIQQQNDLSRDFWVCEENINSYSAPTAVSPQHTYNNTTKTHTGESYLKQHMTLCTDNKHFSCSVCGKLFSQKGNLNVHMKLHTGENMFYCSVCDKSFLQRNKLRDHMNTHYRDRYFSCSVCGKSFTQKGTLNNHMKVHTHENMFYCSVCNKSYLRKSQLSTHMNTHYHDNCFSCSVCGKLFSQKGNLNVHMIIHTGEKRYSCSVCGKVCSQGSSLKSHIKSHTKSDTDIHPGDKSYSCVCGKSFSNKRTLNIHKKTHNMFT